jgi:1-acyl-sn-glycerol-3-phosphate acyltransferase
LIALRSFVFVALFYLWSLAVSIVIFPLLLGPSRWMVRSFHVWSVGIHWLLKVCCDIRVEIRGREHIPTGSALVAPKHQCMLDVFSQFSALPNSLWVMKQELAWIPFLGWYAVKTGAIVIKREEQAAALRHLLREAKARFANNRQLVIFPEGTRGPPGVPGVYKPGIAALYREFDLPVHPVATNSGVHWPAHGFMRKPGTIVFEYLEPIPPGLKRAEFMRTLEERIETASMKLLSL